MMGLPSLHALDEYRLGTERARIWLASEATDMRCGFDRLAERVRAVIGDDPLSGHLFLFTNKTRTRLKALVWDGSGLWVCAKRLEKGRFRWPQAEGRHSVTMRSEELAMLVNGLDVKHTRQRNWYRKSA